MRAREFATLSFIALLASPAAAEQQQFPAVLAGHVVMPAASFVPAPEDAPDDLRVSGKFIGGIRQDKIGSVEGLSNGRPTGLKTPFKGQPLQGHSGRSSGNEWPSTM